MATSIKALTFGKDHVVPVEPAPGGTFTIQVLSGDTLYYADNPQVSAGLNQGSLTAGQSLTFSLQQWVISAGRSDVTLTVPDAPLPTFEMPPSVVSVSSPVQNQGLIWNGSAWVPAGDPTSVGFTPANTFKARAALARCRLDSFARITMLGDSITQGAGASAWPANTYPAHVAAMLASDGLPSGGTGVILLGSNQTGSSLTAQDSRVTLNTGTWSYGQPGLAGTVCLVGQQVNADKVTIQDPNQQVDKFTIYLLAGSGAGPISVQVDAQAAITLDPNDGTNPTVGGITWRTITAGAAGIHSLVINAPTAVGKNVYLTGVEGTLGSVGARISRIGIGGQNSGGLLAAISPLTSFLPADLTVLMIGTNDFLQQVPLATYLSNLNSLISNLLAGGSVILLIAPPPNDAGAIAWTQYVAQMYSAVATNNIWVIDLGQRWISYANAAAMYNDAHHPNNRGNWDMATAVHAALRQASLV